MKIDILGDRMKIYERIEAGRMFIPTLPIVARIDGRSFSKFTKGMERPYDEIMSRAMINTTKRLVKETNAKIGYTQSDEISLLFHSDDINSQVFFNGKIAKMNSQLAALATLYFYDEINRNYSEYASRMPTFDSRVWQVPSKEEACNVFRWREWDAMKNSVSMLAQHHFTHLDLQGKNADLMKLMLEEVGVVWGNFPNHFKRGTYIGKVERNITFEEIDNLPEKHHARLHPEVVVKRTSIQELDMPIFNRITNEVEVLFYNKQPIVEENDEKI